ncbi:MAG: hypothetical protein ACPGVJ_08215 [Mangrovicoccus sp.]
MIKPSGSRGTAWLARLLVPALLIVALASIWATNQALMERFSKDSRAQIEVRLALFSGNIIGEIERLKVVPLLLAQDPAVVRSLATGDYARTSQKLIEYRDEIGAAALRLYDTSGRVVGSTERVDLGKVHRSEPFSSMRCARMKRSM